MWNRNEKLLLFCSTANGNSKLFIRFLFVLHYTTIRLVNTCVWLDGYFPKSQPEQE